MIDWIVDIQNELTRLRAENEELNRRLTVWEEWGKRVEEAFLDDGTDLCDSIQLLLNDIPEIK